MSNLNLILNFKIDLNSKCEICVQTKQPRKPFKSIKFRNSSILEFIHSDVCDSNQISTHGGSRYFVTFIDDFSKYCYAYLIKTKDEVFNKFKIYKTEVENQLEKKIKILRPN